MSPLALLIVWAGYSWMVPTPSDWRVEQPDSKSGLLHLLVGREPPSSSPRRPFQFAIAQTEPFHRATISVEARPLARSLILVYAYRDPAHFDYAHLSTDAGTREAHHNGIFHVYGGERVRISDTAGPPAFAETGRWYKIVLDWDGGTGTVHVNVDGVDVPALHGVDLSLNSGRIGLGSFDETAEFRNLRIKGE